MKLKLSVTKDKKNGANWPGLNPIKLSDDNLSKNLLKKKSFWIMSNWILFNMSTFVFMKSLE